MFTLPHTFMTNRRTFIRQVGAGALGYSLLSTLPYCNSKPGKEAINPPFTLPRSTPEQQGMASSAIHTFLDQVRESGIQFHSVMVLRNGHVVAEGWWDPYEPEYIHQLYSLSKSFTSTAVGFAVAEGLLTVEDPVTSFFPEEAPVEISPNLAAMKVKHLLTMSAGQAKEPLQTMRDTPEESWVKTFLAWPVDHEPGSRFLYNTAATYMLSAIVQKLTGKKVIDYLKPRLFAPLDIQDMDWAESPQGINVGGYGFRVKTEDITKLGLLYLQKGIWNGQQILSPEWVAAATSKQIQSSSSNPDGPGTSDWDQGYGYQFWRNTVGGYRADGAFGQFSLVLPEKNAVVAITGQSMDMQASMKLVWDYLLPAMQDGQPLPEDTAAQESLKKELQALAIVPPAFQASSPLAATLSGKKFILDTNGYGTQSVQLDFNDQHCVLTVAEQAGEVTLTCGYNQWIKEGNRKERGNSLFAIPVRLDSPSLIAASAGWQNEQTLVIHLQYVELCHGDQYTFAFDQNNLTLSFMNSVSKENPDSPETREPVTGTLVAV